MADHADAIPSKGAGKSPRVHRTTRRSKSTVSNLQIQTAAVTKKSRKSTSSSSQESVASGSGLLGGSRSVAVKRKSSNQSRAKQSDGVKNSKISKLEEKSSSSSAVAAAAAAAAGRSTNNKTPTFSRTTSYRKLVTDRIDSGSTTEEDDDAETEDEEEAGTTDSSSSSSSPQALAGVGAKNSTQHQVSTSSSSSRCCTRSRSNSAGVVSGASGVGGGSGRATTLLKKKSLVERSNDASSASTSTGSARHVSGGGAKKEEESKNLKSKVQEVPKEPVSSRLRQLPSRVAAASQLHVARIARAHEAARAAQQSASSSSSSTSNNKQKREVSKTVAPANLRKVGLVSSSTGSSTSSFSQSGRRSPKTKSETESARKASSPKTLRKAKSATATSQQQPQNNSELDQLRYRLRSRPSTTSFSSTDVSDKSNKNIRSSTSGGVGARPRGARNTKSLDNNKVVNFPSENPSSVRGSGRGAAVATSNTTGSCASSRCGRGAGGPSGAEGSATGKSGEPGMNTSSSNQQSSSSRRGVVDPAASENSGTSAGSGGPTSSSTSTTAIETNSSSTTAGGGGGGAAAAASAFSRGLAMLSGEVDADEGDMGRLQALLESRGLPPHLFGTLAPRMQQLLQRGISASSGNVTKAQQLLQGLQATGDEGQQLQAAIEMCQLLVMGNEDTLAGFPIKQTVPALIQLLSMEHNFDIMNHACRALTYMMEALPRSTPVVAEAVPVLLEKLQVIQCMDVAEQSLTALEMLSRRHAKTILQAKGVEACLTFLDFFSIVAQRAALAITANCMQNLHLEEFPLVADSLHFMATRLMQQDKKSVESVCLGFSRLVDSLNADPKKLEEIAGPELLANLQQLLVVTPPIVSTATFILVLRMLAQLCSRCPTIAVKLLEQNIVGTLSSLLLRSSPVTTNSENTADEIELVQRNPQELLEMMNLIAELLPKLPKDGIFIVNTMMSNPVVAAQDAVQWQWKDDRGQWTSYSPFDSRIIEAAHQSGEDEISLSMQGRTYTVDFLGLQQINEDTGTSRTVQRKVSPFFSLKSGTDATTAEVPAVPEDERATYLALHPDFSLQFLRPLFALLSEANSSSAGPAVRTGCLKTLLRIVHFLPAESLQKNLKPQLVSNNLASMLGSSDLKIVVGSFQLCYLFMEKLQQDLCVHFRREGVFHQISRISSSEVVGPSPIKSDISSLLGTTPPNSSDVGLVGLGLGSLNFLSTKALPCSSGGSGGSSSSSSTSHPIRVPVPSVNLAASAASVLGGLQHHHHHAETMTNNTSSASAGPRPNSGGDNGNTIAAAVGGIDISSALGATSVLTRGTNPISIQPLANPIVNPISVSPLTTTSVDSGTGEAGAAGLHTNIFGVPKLNKVEKGGAGGGGLVSSGICPPALASKLPAVGEIGGEKSSEDLQLLYDPFKRKRVSKRPIPTSTTRRSRQDEALANSPATPGHSAAGFGSSSSGSSQTSKRSSKSGFFASLHPSRWTRGSGGATAASNNSNTSGGSGSSSSRDANLTTPTTNLPTADRTLQHVGAGPGPAAGGFAARYHTHNLASSYKEQVKNWLKEQSSAFTMKYCRSLSESNDGVGGKHSVEQHPDELVLPKLNEIIQNIRQESKVMEALRDLRVVVMESDISSFEINHSGLIPALLAFLTDEAGYTSSRDCRIRSFIHVLADCPLDFLSGEKLESVVGAKSETNNPTALSSLVSKLNSCLSQLEQFQVKVHEVPTNSATSRTAAPTSALRFFNTHQLKCNLQRHPSSTTLRQWKGGPVKIDSLALVQTIERYLIAKGFGRLRESHDSADSEDDNSDDDIDDTLAAAVISQGSGRHKIQFLINDNVLPYTMTVYQAIRQFGLGAQDQAGELESDLDPSSALISTSRIWSQTHTIYYRPLPEDAAAAANAALSSSSKKRSKNSKSSKTKKDPLWNEGTVPDPVPPYLPFLVATLPDGVSVTDPSLSVLNLLRVIHGVCRYWRYLYWPLIHDQPLIPHSEFINSKIAAKAQRQLQDPVVIMAGNVPQWLQQIGVYCPFLFPFETRQMLFYSITFDRDRALQRLLDSVPELNGSEREDRVAPRLDRRKRTVSRDNILHHAEQLMNDFGSSRPLLEVQYENEVGTGLGPTLEFYALVSQELQKKELDLWHAESLVADVSISTDKLISTNSSGYSKQKAFIHSNFGLYPKPLGRAVKAGHLSKVKNKFKFLGKFMAKAVMDSRMVDLPLSKAVYKWVLDGDNAMCLADMADVDSTIARSIRQLVNVVSQKKALERKMSPTELATALESLTLDGCQIENLGLDFTLPGHPSIDLKKGGRDIAVTIHNLEEYIKLVYHWMLIGGIQRQMESWREGFDSVFPSSSLKMFYPEELEMVFCGANQSANENWEMKTLMECCRADHGYTLDSKAIQILFQIMSQYNSQERRKFLQFVTGSPRLPVGGFRALQPPLTVVRKTIEGTTAECDEYLPSVMTCVNYLKLPDYSTVEIMRKRLRVAVDEGQLSFHLS